MKEAFHNVLKHSGASEAHLRISATTSLLQIEIEDNGCGFDVKNGDNGGRKGNGLENMRKRIEHLNGEMELVTTRQKRERA